MECMRKWESTFWSTESENEFEDKVFQTATNKYVIDRFYWEDIFGFSRKRETQALVRNREENVAYSTNCNLIWKCLEQRARARKKICRDERINSTDKIVNDWTVDLERLIFESYFLKDFRLVVLSINNR